jgi:hypothetical protein
VYELIVRATDGTQVANSRSKTTRTLPNPPTKPVVSIDYDSMTYNSFAASWTGGQGATSYIYTLNGSVVEMLSNGLNNEVSFGSLTASTNYTLVITAVNSGGQTAADPVSTETLEAPPFQVAIHQFISNTTDVGSQPVVPTIIDPDNAISYTTEDGRGCIFIDSDGTNPRINIPMVFTQATPFTFSFWMKFDGLGEWHMPLTINGSDITIGPGFSLNTITVKMIDNDVKLMLTTK